MKLSGLTLETIHFEDYLSFLTEVVELELIELTDCSMKLDINTTWLEIKKVPTAPHQGVCNVEFSMDEEEYKALKQRIDFFSYRRGPTGFNFLGAEIKQCTIVDPDGRSWRFLPTL